MPAEWAVSVFLDTVRNLWLISEFSGFLLLLPERKCTDSQITLRRKKSRPRCCFPGIRICDGKSRTFWSRPRRIEAVWVFQSNLKQKKGGRGERFHPLPVLCLGLLAYQPNLCFSVIQSSGSRLPVWIFPTCWGMIWKIDHIKADIYCFVLHCPLYSNPHLFYHNPVNCLD